MPELPSDAHVLVTGANGFVGSRVCQRLSGTGTDVRALVRRSDADLSRAGDVDVAVATFDDRVALADALSGITHIVHCAAAAGRDLDLATAVNVAGTRSVLEAAAEAGVRRVVHISTTSVVADDEMVVDAEAELVGDDAAPYAVTKRDAEDVVDQVARDTGLETVVLRPPAVLGWAPSSTWGQRIPGWVAEGELPFSPDRRANLGWVHVDDLADAVVRALADDHAVGRTYVVASGTTTWGEFLDEIVSWFPGCPDPFGGAGTPPAQREWSAERITKDLGWSPEVTFEAALAEAAHHHS